METEVNTAKKTRDMFTGLYNDSMDFYNRMVRMRETCKAEQWN